MVEPHLPGHAATPRDSRCWLSQPAASRQPPAACRAFPVQVKLQQGETQDTSRKWSLMSSCTSSSSNFSREGYRVKKRSSKCHVVGFWKRGFRRASPGVGRGSRCPRARERAEAAGHVPSRARQVVGTCRPESCSLLTQHSSPSAGQGRRKGPPCSNCPPCSGCPAPPCSRCPIPFISCRTTASCLVSHTAVLP